MLRVAIVEKVRNTARSSVEALLRVFEFEFVLRSAPLQRTAIRYVAPTGSLGALPAVAQLRVVPAGSGVAFHLSDCQLRGRYACRCASARFQTLAAVLIALHSVHDCGVRRWARCLP